MQHVVYHHPELVIVYLACCISRNHLTNLYHPFVVRCMHVVMRVYCSELFIKNVELADSVAIIVYISSLSANLIRITHNLCTYILTHSERLYMLDKKLLKTNTAFQSSQ